MKKYLAFASALALSAGFSGAVLAQEIGVVVKIGGIPWFNAMEEGIKKKGAELGVTAYMIGPTSADPALQVQAIEDLIAKGVDVIGVVPNDEAALEPVLHPPEFSQKIRPYAGMTMPLPRASSRIRPCNFSNARTSIWRMRSRLTP